MWITENRARYNRDKLRYPSDLTEEEWTHIEPLIPPAKRGGRKRSVNVREVLNGLMYVLSTGCQCAPYRRICRPKARSFITLIYGTTRARSSGFIMHSM